MSRMNGKKTTHTHLVDVFYIPATHVSPVFHLVCVCVFMKLHIAPQSDIFALVILKVFNKFWREVYVVIIGV